MISNNTSMGLRPAEEKAGAVGLIKRGFSYGTE